VTSWVVPVEGAELHYVIEGRGTPSNSSLEISKITLDTYLDDIDKVRRTLGLDKTAVFGHSIHSYIALEYARKYPKNTSHVVMTGNTPYRVAAEVADKFWESDASDERKMILKQNLEKIAEDELSQMSPSRKAWPG
jgi:proline iminopeptidase